MKKPVEPAEDPAHSAPHNGQDTRDNRPTVGCLFAGIGGFDLGFERAGWRVAWQVEADFVNRAVLADRFPASRVLSDVRTASSRNLAPVDCVAFGSPCTNISTMGHCRKGGQPGLRGPESGLFFEATRIIGELRPRWVAFENVPALLHSNAGRDLQEVVGEFAGLGYLGHARVLDARHFGVPQGRRRLFMVAGLGLHPHADFLADAGPVGTVPRTVDPFQELPGDGWAGYTLTAADNGSRCNIGSELFVAVEDGWGQMAERAREAEVHGLLWGLDEADAAEAWSAGNAVVPQVAQWLAGILMRSHKGEL
jgi:DNA (cytosine-5)-methyltransferase 1